MALDPSRARRPQSLDRRELLELATLAGLGSLPSCAGSSARGGSRAENGFTCLTVSGTPFERGRAHGAALRGSIEHGVERWMDSLSPPDDTSVEDYLEAFARDTDFASAMRAHTPDLLEELEGISAGSGVPLSTLYAQQLVDEEWCYAAARDFGEFANDKCSVIALAPSEHQPAFVAQNLDLPPELAHEMVLLRHVDPAGLETLVLTIPGLLGFNGVNSRGVAVCVNALLPLRSARRGLPVACVVRGVLARESLEAARAFVEGVPHASGQCYTLGDPAGIACLEASAGGVVRTNERSAACAHTNHPLASDDLGALGRWIGQQPPDKVVGLRNSKARLSACEARLDAARRDPLPGLRAALGSHDDAADPVCRHREPDEAFSAACTIFELRRGQPTLHVTGNPPCGGAFSTHALSSGAG